MLRRVGIGAAFLLPAVVSVLVPTPAEALTTCVSDCTGNLGKQCQYPAAAECCATAHTHAFAVAVLTSAASSAAPEARAYASAVPAPSPARASSSSRQPSSSRCSTLWARGTPGPGSPGVNLKLPFCHARNA